MTIMGTCINCGRDNSDPDTDITFALRTAPRGNVAQPVTACDDTCLKAAENVGWSVPTTAEKDRAKALLMKGSA